jgi:Family of unknown function (DUF6220)
MISQQQSTESNGPVLGHAGGGVKDGPAALWRVAVARHAYVVGIYLLGLAVVVQFLLAGLGIFWDAQFLQVWHAEVGAGVIFGLSLLLVPVGLLGRVPGSTLWLTAAVAGLVVVQSLLLAPYHLNATGLLRAVSGLHVVNALLIFWVVLRLVTRASNFRTAGNA